MLKRWYLPEARDLGITNRRTPFTYHYTVLTCIAWFKLSKLMLLYITCNNALADYVLTDLLHAMIFLFQFP